jgi:hypothetical protein
MGKSILGGTKGDKKNKEQRQKSKDKRQGWIVDSFGS